MQSPKNIMKHANDVKLLLTVLANFVRYAETVQCGKYRLSETERTGLGVRLAIQHACLDYAREDKYSVQGRTLGCGCFDNPIDSC